MAFDPSQFMNKGGTATEEPPSQPLVNQSLPRGFENFMVPQPEPPKTPETWFGEGTAAFGRNIDELQAMGYGAGALTASWLGADSAKKWFMNGYNANISEAEKNPETVKSLGDIQSFDDFTRYSISAIAGFAPMVMQGLAASVIGGAIGTVAEPGAGTVGGGAIGLVARKAVQKLLSQGVSELTTKELGEYLAGKVEKSALSEATQDLLTKEASSVAKGYGMTTAAGLANASIMTGAFYGELENNPDIPESDKRLAATVGGILASIPMTSFATSLAKQFGMKNVTEEAVKNIPEVANEVAEKSGYFARFITTGGKELMKNAGHMGAAMFTQTAIEIAAKKWADPNTRWDFLNYSPADWQSMWDATVKGAIGGGALGGLISTVVSTPIDPHPDPQVRTDIKDIQQRANDVPIKNPDETPDHVELSGLLNKEKILNQNINSGKLPEDQLKLAQADLQQNLAQQEVIKKKLGLLTDETGGAAATTTTTVPLVNQSSSDAAKLEELKKTFTAPTREPGATVLLDPNREAVKNKQADIEAHIESVAGGTEYGQKLKEAITPDIVNMMAAEDVHLRSETDPNVKPEDRRAFALSMEKDGSLSLYVPTATDPEAAHAMATEGGLHVAIAHELAHVADFVNVRREWKAGDQSVPVRTFTEERMRQRGESARKSEAFLPAVAKAGYDTGKLGKMSDVELGMEIPRMAIEIARLGKTSEVTDALSRAAQKDFKAKPFFRDWINALQRIHGFIQKFIDPQTANPEILKAVNDMHATLDEYGLLVNQKPAEAAPLTTPEVTPKVEPTAPNAPPVVAPTPTRYSNAEMRKMDAAELRKHANEVGVPPSDIPQSRKDVMAAIKEQYAKEDAKTEAAAPAPPVEAPAPPAPAVLPSQQTPAAPAVPEVPKGPSPYKIFRAAIKEGKGPTEVANKYLDLLQSKNDLPSTKMEIAAAHIDLQNRHSGLVMSRERFTELAKEHIKKQQNETKLKQQQQAAAEGTQLTAKKASVTEPNQPEDVAGHEGDLSGDTGTEERYDHPISEQLAHKASSARPGNKLKEMRSYLAEHRPELVPHFDNVVQEAGRSNIDEEAARRIRENATPIRGRAVVRDLEVYQHTVFINSQITDAIRKLAEERGVAVFAHGENPQEGHYIVDTSGDWVHAQGDDPEATLVNKRASIIWPVNITDKLKEAQATDGIPETHALSALGFPTIDKEVVQELDKQFGENQWILKNFHTKSAMKSTGVGFAEAVKAALDEDSHYFANQDTGYAMIQALHNITESDRASNVKIRPGQELRVHIMTDPEGGVKVVPFSSFWKPAISEENVDTIHLMTPLTIENEDIRAAHQRAIDSISSLPREERSGQSFGMDIVRLADGGWGTVENNPTDEFGGSSYMLVNPMAQDALIASLLGEKPIHAEMAEAAHDAMIGDSIIHPEDGSLVNQKGVGPEEESSKGLTAHMPRLSGPMESRLDTLLERTKDELASAFEDTPEGRRRTRERGARPNVAAIGARDMEYWTQPVQKPMEKAEAVVSQNNLKDLINDLDEHVFGSKYDLTAHDELKGGPTAGINALYQTVMQHIGAALTKLRDQGKDRTLQIWLEKKFQNLETNLRQYVTGAGRAGQISGKVDKVINGFVARNAYVEPILKHMEKVLGPKGDRIVKMMSDRLNELMGDEAQNAVMSPAVIAHLQNIKEAFDTPKFQKELRKTMTETDKKAGQIVGNMVNRLAAHMAMQDMGGDQINEIAKRMANKITSIPVSDPTEVEQKVFNETIKKIFSDNARKLGLIPESEAKGTPLESQFAAIMKNPELYEQFTDEVHRRLMEEHKPEPGSPFHEQLMGLHDWMQQRGWSDNMVESLVNKNMRELGMKYSKLAREKFATSEDAIADIKDQVRRDMAERGVDNEPLLEKMMQDLEDSFHSRVEQARLDFMGSGSGVRDFLKSMGTNLAEKAKEHSNNARIGTEKFKEWLKSDFGLPDTHEMPIASSLADAMQRHYNTTLADKREEIVKNMVKAATADKSEKVQKKAMDSVDKILKLVNLGVMRDENVYNAIAPKFGLPPFRQDIADKAEEYGDFISKSPSQRLTNRAKQELAMLIASQKGIKPYDMFLAGLYVNYLSGISTSAVNIQSNAASLAGYFATAAAQDIATNRGRFVPAMFRAFTRAATGSAVTEMKDAFLSGHSLHSTGEKFFVNHNVMEMDNPVFKSNFDIGSDSLNEFGRGIFERTAAMEHNLYKRVGGKWVGRALNAQDMYFYKMAQDIAYASKTGITETHEMRSSALMEAEQQMRSVGLDPNSSRENLMKRDLIANDLVNQKRQQNAQGKLDPELHRLWLESHDEALDATFRQDPKGLLGKAAKMIEKWTQGEDESPNPVGRLLIPFTRIAANVTNQMLEWTPYGMIRYGIGHTFGEDFRLKDENGNSLGRDPKVLIRSVLGTLGGMSLMALFGKDADKKDPFFAVYDDGSKNPQTRRQMMDAGWRPKTIKVGNAYISYAGTPFSMTLSIIGRMLDDYRDGVHTSPYDVGMSSAAVAMLQAVTHESFLSSLTDLLSAVDSPNPEAKMSRLMSRAAIAPFVPNLAQQIDKWVNPNVQQAQGFWESFIREIPYARTTLKPAINIFGENIKRDPGINLPGMERFLTMEKSDDPVYNLLGEKRITVPGFSKSTKLMDKVMDRDQYYQYVKIGGPELKKEIQAHIEELSHMNREQAQEAINELARVVKQKARDAMRAAQDMSKY